MQLQSSSIGYALVVEALAFLVVAFILAFMWDIRYGLSAGFGAMAYILPYTLAYLLFFDVLPGNFSLLGKAKDAKKRRYVVGGFVAAELVKILLTIGLLLLIYCFYRQANWYILLLSFGLSIGINWVILLVVVFRSTSQANGFVSKSNENI